VISTSKHRKWTISWSWLDQAPCLNPLLHDHIDLEYHCGVFRAKFLERLRMFNKNVFEELSNNEVYQHNIPGLRKTRSERNLSFSTIKKGTVRVNNEINKGITECEWAVSFRQGTRRHENIHNIRLRLAIRVSLGSSVFFRQVRSNRWCRGTAKFQLAVIALNYGKTRSLASTKLQWWQIHERFLPLVCDRGKVTALLLELPCWVLGAQLSVSEEMFDAKSVGSKSEYTVALS
jgi:hypothetical protein